MYQRTWLNIDCFSLQSVMEDFIHEQLSTDEKIIFQNSLKTSRIHIFSIIVITKDNSGDTVLSLTPALSSTPHIASNLLILSL